MLRELARSSPEHIGAYLPDGTAFTFAELQQRVDERRHALDIDARRVPLLVRNTVDSVVAIHSVWQHHASAVLISDAAPDAEVQRRIAETSGAPASDDELIVVFTSGTTGRPKGAAINARALT